MNSTDIPVDASGHMISPFYGNLPTRSTCYIFVVLFGLVTFKHFVQAVHQRAWWLIPTAVLGGVGEVIGWSGRLWSNYKPLNNTPYTIQIVFTCIAPTPFFTVASARDFLNSRLFLTCDIIALFVQAVGGGLVSSPDDDVFVQDGANIMLAGIVFQFASLSVFAISMAEYLFRYATDAPLREQNSSETVAASPGAVGRGAMTKDMKLLIARICFETLFLFIRAVYRSDELADGIYGRILRTEVYFNVLDAAMVVLAMYTMTFLHPARLLRRHPSDKQDASYPMIAKSNFAQP